MHPLIRAITLLSSGFAAAPLGAAAADAAPSRGYSGGCYVHAQIVSPLADGADLYAQGPAKCMSPSGEVISEQIVRIKLTTAMPPKTSLVGTELSLTAL